MIVTGNTRLYPNTYSIYCGMIKRCYNDSATNTIRYKGRGIKVCDRWLGENGFNNFLKDMGPRPENLSLDRIDNNKDYCPENCKWATAKQQANNRGNTIIVAVDGESMSLSNACEYYGMEYGTVYARIRKGMTPIQALTTPLMSYSEAGKKAHRGGSDGTTQ